MDRRPDEGCPSALLSKAPRNSFWKGGVVMVWVWFGVVKKQKTKKNKKRRQKQKAEASFVRV